MHQQVHEVQRKQSFAKQQSVVWAVVLYLFQGLTSALHSPEGSHGHAGGCNATETSKSKYDQVDNTEHTKSLAGTCVTHTHGVSMGLHQQKYRTSM